jgi:ABC-type nickel/cobalt efflux system permease component RcnA
VTRTGFFLSFLSVFLWAGNVIAHPVARNHHDRTIVANLKPSGTSVTVLVAYRLEVDEQTVALDDLGPQSPFRGVIAPALYREKPLEFYGEYMRLYAPILAGNLVARIDGQELKFTCTKRVPSLTDEKGEPLGHLRCDFVFEAVYSPRSLRIATLTFQETNYLLQEGKIDVALASANGVWVMRKVEADAAVKNRPAIEKQPDDEDVLRSVQVQFILPVLPASVVCVAGMPMGGSCLGAASVIMNTVEKLPLPSHAKADAARSSTPLATAPKNKPTVPDAALSADARKNLQTGLGVIMGLLVAGLGAWLLLQRLAGRADHVHIGGGHHHHHDHAHGHHPHSHDPIDQTGLPPSEAPGWGGLILLGMTGGIVPCWDAIALLVVTVGSSEFWLALPLLLCFSAGLASVLVLIGILVVRARGFLGSRWGEGRLVRSLPYISALLIIAMGLWLVYESVNVSEDGDDHDLLALFRRNDVGLGLLFVLAGVLGAAHALTPGHGKTLVAAYLVGQRGTVWHAFVLGLVTTLTHTGIVLAIALVLFFV